MKFKLDENLPAGAARVLSVAGHDVSTVAGLWVRLDIVRALRAVSFPVGVEGAS